MAVLLVHGDYAYTNELDLYRHARVTAEKADLFHFEGSTPNDLWLVEGPDGSCLTADFDAGVREFNKKAYRMARIRVILPASKRYEGFRVS